MDNKPINLKYSIYPINIKDYKISSNLCISQNFSNFLCVNCKNLLLKPKMCSLCDEIYCISCYEEICPQCNNNLNESKIPKNYTNLLNLTLFYCPFKCGEEIILADFIQHLENCNFTPRKIKCLCDIEIITTNKLEELTTHYKSCLEIEEQCPICKSQIARKNLSKHENECKLSKCDECGKEIPTLDYYKHSRIECVNNVIEEFEEKIRKVKLDYSFTIQDLEKKIDNYENTLKMMKNDYENKLKEKEDIINKLINKKFNKITNPHKKYITSLVYINDMIISSSQDKSINIWKNNGDLIKTIVCDYSVNSLSYNSNFIFTGCNEGKINIYNLNDFSLYRSFSDDSGISYILIDNCIITANKKNCIKLWNINNLSLISVMSDHTDYITCLLSLDLSKGKLIVSSSKDMSIKVWIKEKLFTSLIGHKDGVNSICYIICDSIASASNDKTVRLWDVYSGTCFKVLDHSENVNIVSNSGKILYSVLSNHIKLWNLEDESSKIINCECDFICNMILNKSEAFIGAGKFEGNYEILSIDIE